MKVASTGAAFRACMKQQAEWFVLRDLFQHPPPEGVTVDKASCAEVALVAERMAVLAGQIAAFVMPAANDASASDGSVNVGPGDAA